MNDPAVKYCPGTLAAGFETYSTACLRRLFNGAKVSHVLPYDPPGSNDAADLFLSSQKRISVSGVQIKFSVFLSKNKLHLIEEGEHGTYILKPIPTGAGNSAQMPANEHLTMQIARQVYGIETADNGMIFFRNGEQAYITKRFDVTPFRQKLAVEDFASLAGRTPQTHGTHYKYRGNYLELFEIIKSFLPVYKVEAPRLFKLILFNYLFSNGDAHFKNFSIVETPMGDFRLSPAYDLLNSRLHVNDSDFALEEGLLPKSLAKGKISRQFEILGLEAGLSEKQISTTFQSMLANSDKVQMLIDASFLHEKSKRNYLQLYQGKLKKLAGK